MRLCRVSTAVAPRFSLSQARFCHFFRCSIDALERWQLGALVMRDKDDERIHHVHVRQGERRKRSVSAPGDWSVGGLTVTFRLVARAAALGK